MGLVDYPSSDDDGDGEDDSRQATFTVNTTDSPLPTLPPLPHAFHDLYAATVRTAPTDDPSLHHGRHRAIPHVTGQWPSHLYIEWFPSPSEHALLSQLLASLATRLGQSAVHSLLTSDLGAPLPLHISLSRPFVLTTANKTGFLADLTASIRASGVPQSTVTLAGLDWFRSPDAARAFLVLRVKLDDPLSPVQPLAALLRRCNALLLHAGQPALYTDGGSDDEVVAGNGDASAFHVSIAWTLAADLEAWADTTRQVYETWKQANQKAAALFVPVKSIKSKIGNVVTDIPLARARN
ncbi:poly(U)-specific 3'-to-5' RNA exonuclease [Sporothrix epigloea]|uniref:U6 snRNA phosphodiesterase n=1 Tax=Sporothrix epigloea TaxID=1892477 RepID=A0ABP0DKE3_9PEZI